MLPRNKKKFRTRIFFSACLILACSFSYSPASAENFFIKFYQEHISVADGNRCRMYPSCSQYANNAVKKHGMLIGWMMACDRLVRCGRDEKDISGTIVKNNQEFIFDPVSSNDFWWFNKESKE